MNSQELKDWLHAIIAGIVSNPDKIEIEQETDEMGVKYTVRVAEEDRGKIIGRKGANVGAIRTLLLIAGYRGDIRASLILDVPDIDPGRKREEYLP